MNSVSTGIHGHGSDQEQHRQGRKTVSQVSQFLSSRLVVNRLSWYTLPFPHTIGINDLGWVYRGYRG